jgi:hypothetical protein
LALIIWDRLFNTFEVEKEEPLFGITTSFKSWNPVWANVHYWLDLVKLSKKAIKKVDKILVFFTAPGWQPKELGGFQPPKEIDKTNYVKFTTQMEGPLKIYVLFHYIILLVVAAVFLNFYKAFTLVECIVPSLLILFNTVVLGALTENKNWGRTWEYLRLIITAIAGIYYCNLYDFLLNYVLLVAIIIVTILSILRYKYANQRWVVAEAILAYVKQYNETE